MKIFLAVILFIILKLAQAAGNPYDMETLLNQRDVIWGFDFLTSDTLLFTERGGKIYSYELTTKSLTEVKGTPKVYSEGQGGMLDLRVHQRNGYIYLTYSAPLTGGKSATTLARFKLNKNLIKDFKVIFEANANVNPYHFGSRIEFLNDKVFITSGERGDRPACQKLDNYFGKVIRMNEDGSNPQIWTLGHRNQQGLTLKPGTEELWESEFGPQGGDEINLLKKGANYGWAIVTYGKEYEGPKIGEGTKKKGMEEPVTNWVPSISPSAITFWNDDLWLATLSGEHLRRLSLEGQKVIKQEEYFKDLGWRFRNIRPGPDGNLWFSTDEGRLGKVKLKK